eukprot:s928_g1.t1
MTTVPLLGVLSVATKTRLSLLFFGQRRAQSSSYFLSRAFSALAIALAMSSGVGSGELSYPGSYARVSATTSPSFGLGGALRSLGLKPGGSTVKSLCGAGAAATDAAAEDALFGGTVNPAGGSLTLG